MASVESMANETPTSIYDELGVKPVINALGNWTMLGGSSPSPRVRAAVESAHRYYVDMAELLDRAGKLVAEMIGAEAAYITPGAAAALALGAAACMTEGDQSKMARLPDTTGMKNEILIQKLQRYKYDRAMTVFGARLVEVGDETGTTAQQIEAAIGPSTAAIFCWPTGQKNVLGLAELVSIGKAHGVPVLVDGAGQVYPVERMRSFPASGADLTAYAAKYFGAPNASGFLAGRRDLVEAASVQGFINFEHFNHWAIGRPLKLDRQGIISVVVALREWLEMDHDARLRGYDRKVRTIARAIQGIEGVGVELLPAGASVVTSLRVHVDPARTGKTAAGIGRALEAGNPAIWVGTPNRYGAFMGVPNPDDYFMVHVNTLADGDEEVVAERLKQVLAG